MIINIKYNIPRKDGYTRSVSLWSVLCWLNIQCKLFHIGFLNLRLLKNSLHSILYSCRVLFFFYSSCMISLNFLLYRAFVLVMQCQCVLFHNSTKMIYSIASLFMFCVCVHTFIFYIICLKIYNEYQM